MQRSSLIEGYRRTGDRYIADAIPCMLAKIEGDAVQRALELAGVQFIDADDSAARVCACGGTEL